MEPKQRVHHTHTQTHASKAGKANKANNASKTLNGRSMVPKKNNVLTTHTHTHTQINASKTKKTDVATSVQRDNFEVKALKTCICMMKQMRK